MAPEVCQVLARAFASNPGHLAAFGGNVLVQNEAFFRTALPLLKGPKFVAMAESRVLGLIHWVDSSKCQVTAAEKVRLFPQTVARLGWKATLRALSWLSTWEKHDPKQPHVHLGPIGVLPETQGQRVGSRLMMKYCEVLTETGQAGYLETDRLENVEFYRRFGFETTLELPVIGAMNYFMPRPTSVPSTADAT